MKPTVAPILIGMALLAVPTAHAKMIRSDDLQQNTANLNLCISRARSGSSGNQDVVPFEIDDWYLAQSRKDNPNVTFFATGSGSLIECGNQAGLYGPVVRSGESWFFHIFRPAAFEPSIHTNDGQRLAAKTCLKDVPEHTDLSTFDHAAYYTAHDVDYISPKTKPNPTVAGVQVSSYDVEVLGIAYFKTSGIDFRTLQFTCLYSPMLKFKAVGWRRDTAGPRVWLKSARQADIQHRR